MTAHAADLSDLVRHLGMSSGIENVKPIGELSRAKRAADLASQMATRAATLPRNLRRRFLAETNEVLRDAKADFLAEGASLEEFAQFELVFHKMLAGCLQANSDSVPVQLMFEIEISGEMRSVAVATYRPGSL